MFYYAALERDSDLAIIVLQIMGTSISLTSSQQIINFIELLL